MEETHVAPGEAGVPGSGQGESQGIMCCKGLAVSGVSHSVTYPHEGTGWYQGCPSAGAHATWEDLVTGSLSPGVELGVSLQC